MTELKKEKKEMLGMAIRDLTDDILALTEFTHGATEIGTGMLRQMKEQAEYIQRHYK